MPLSLVTLKTNKQKNGARDDFCPLSDRESTSSNRNESQKFSHITWVHLQTTSLWNKRRKGRCNICLLTKTYCTNTARRVDAIAPYWLETSSMDFLLRGLKGFLVLIYGLSEKVDDLYFLNLYKTTQSISLDWNLMDVSVIVGPGRGNEGPTPPPHLRSFHYIPPPPAFFKRTSSEASLNGKPGVSGSCCF